MSRTRLATNKDLRELAMLALEQQWEVEKTHAGHLRWTSPMGDEYVSAMTPSSYRTIQNIKSELKARGLVTNRAEWQKMQRDQAPPPELILSLAESIDRIKTAFQCSGVPLHNVEWSPEIVAELQSMVRPDGFLDLNCGCGRAFAHPLGLIIHRRKKATDKCNPPHPTKDEDMSKKPKTVIVKPLRCAEDGCSESFWKNESTLLADHVKAAHNKQQCPHCQRWYSMTRGGLTRHVHSCSENPNPTPGYNRKYEPTFVAQSAPVPEPTTNGDKSSAPVSSMSLEPGLLQANQAVSQAPPDMPVLDSSPVAEKPKPKPTPTVKRSSTATDDELWALLEMVLDGPITMNRESFQAIQAWMESTRRLFHLKEQL